MKKFLAMLLSLVLLATLFAACTDSADAPAAPDADGAQQDSQDAPADDSSEPATDTPATAGTEGDVIAVIPKSLLYDYWQYVRIGSQKAGLDYGYTIDFQGTRTDTDLEGQIKLVEDFIQRGVAAICISPVNPDGMVPVLQQAHDAGIPVIIIDGKLNADFPYSTISTDDEAGGKFAAEKLQGLVGDAGGTFAVVSAVPGAVQEGGREKGFTDQLATYENYNVLETYYGQGDRNKTYSITQDILTSNPDITGFYSTNEGSSAGVLLGLIDDEANKDKTFVAFDPSTEILDAIREGFVDGAVAQNPFLIGYTGVENAVKVLKDEAVEKHIPVPVTWVTSENIDDPEVANVLKPNEVL